MKTSDFRQLGRSIVDELADYLDDLDERSIMISDNNQQLKTILRAHELQEESKSAVDVFSASLTLLRKYSFNSNHPRQWGYIIPTVDPLTSLAELVTGVFNQNLAGWEISPIATEIECQTVRWLAQIVGFDESCDGIFVNGGNVANFSAMLCARQNMLRDSHIKQLYEEKGSDIFTIYASIETHTWIDKLTKLFGFSQYGLRLVPSDHECKIDIVELQNSINRDLANGLIPLALIATAGTTSTGAVDPIVRLSEIAQHHNMWLHVDGAYGAPAACLDSAEIDLKSLSLADSVAIDPHKWLYTSYEAGCVLIKDRNLLRETFSSPDAFISDPKYYQDEPVSGEKNFLLHGLQNSRSFRALKVWLQLQTLGMCGLKKRLKKDIYNAKYLYCKASAHPQLEARTQNLSVVTFRYIPSIGDDKYDCDDISMLNKELLYKLNRSGIAYLSFTEISGSYLLRACFVNLKTSTYDIDMVLERIVAIGNAISQS